MVVVPGWAVGASVAIGVGLALAAGGAWLGGAIYRSVAPLPPTARQLREEALDDHALFRHFRTLKGKIAWRQIGVYPTPIHTVAMLTPGGANVRFRVKREDLAHPQYGGNKLRTLQHQLAACEAHRESHPDAVYSLLGSFGSNQVVATKLHGARAFHLPMSALEALTFIPDLPDLDNTLNLLSSLSLGGRVVLTPLAALSALASRLWRASDKVFPPGGHNVAGVLGQIGACLELAEQIDRGETPDPAAIYLPYGSGCTTTGLVIGVALSRHLGLRAFRAPEFKIVSVVVHHAFAALHRMVGALFFHRMPLSVSWSIDAVTAYLASLGVPDLTQLCHETREQCLEIVTDPDVVGTYGSHSKKSLPAAQSYDNRERTTLTGDPHQGFDAATAPLWLCGHFAAKPFAVMLERLDGGEHAGKDVLFWQTKSQTQPVQSGLACDPNGVWEERAMFEAAAGAKLQRWAAKGQAHSLLRPGGYPDEYRQLMKEVPPPPP